jgi:hypothetical protein
MSALTTPYLIPKAYALQQTTNCRESIWALFYLTEAPQTNYQRVKHFEHTRSKRYTQLEHTVPQWFMLRLRSSFAKAIAVANPESPKKF